MKQKIHTYIRTVVIYVSFIFGMSTFLAALTTQETFDQASTAFAAGNCDHALNLLQEISKKNSAVFYNLGECFLKQEKYGQALLYFRRAEQRWGLWGRYDLLNKIEAAKKLQSTAVHMSISNALIGLYSRSVMTSLPLIVIQIMVLILWTLLFFFVKRFGRTRNYVLISIFFILLCATSTLLVNKYSMSIKKTGVVLNKVHLFSGPGKNFATIAQLPQAQEADIIRELGEFVKVRINKYTGWIEKQNIEEI